MHERVRHLAGELRGCDDRAVDSEQGAAAEAGHRDEMVDKKCRVELGEDHEERVAEEVGQGEHLPVGLEAGRFAGPEPGAGGVGQVRVESVETADG